MTKTDLAFVSNDASALARYKAERNIYRDLSSMKKELAEVKTKLANVCIVIERIEKKEQNGDTIDS